MSIPQIFLEDFVCRCVRHLDVLHRKITVPFPWDRTRLRCPLFATTNSVVRRREIELANVTANAALCGP